MMKDHLQAHRAHIRNVRFSQNRATWTPLIRVVAAWNGRVARKETFSDHEQRMFEAAKVELPCSAGGCVTILCRQNLFLS